MNLDKYLEERNQLFNKQKEIDKQIDGLKGEKEELRREMVKIQSKKVRVRLGDLLNELKSIDDGVKASCRFVPDRIDTDDVALALRKCEKDFFLILTVKGNDFSFNAGIPVGKGALANGSSLISRVTAVTKNRTTSFIFTEPDDLVLDIQIAALLEDFNSNEFRVVRADILKQGLQQCIDKGMTVEDDNQPENF